MSGVPTLIRVLIERSIQERTCRWSRAELEAYQSRRLAKLRTFVMARSPFYREFHRGLEARELAALPVLTKAMLMDAFDDVVTDRAIRLADVEKFLRDAPPAALFRGRYVALATSGSTGRRGVFPVDTPAW